MYACAWLWCPYRSTRADNLRRHMSSCPYRLHPALVLLPLPIKISKEEQRQQNGQVDVTDRQYFDTAQGWLQAPGVLVDGKAANQQPIDMMGMNADPAVQY